MTQPLHDPGELKVLLNALCDETISPEQMKRLEELILGHPEAEAYYVQYMALHADLVSHLAALPCPTEQVLHQRDSVRPPKPRRVRRGLLWGALAVGGLAAAALLLVLWPAQKVKRISTEQAGERIDDTVAVLVRAPEAVWGETELPTRAGSPLPAGWLRLQSGFAHLEFYAAGVAHGGVLRPRQAARGGAAARPGVHHRLAEAGPGRSRH
jgi:hypothetical protein